MWCATRRASIKQIGSTCLQDFLGGLTPDRAVAMCMFYAQAAGFCEDAEDEGREYRGARSEPRYDLLEVLTITATMVRMHGWCSAGTAKLDPSAHATKSNVLHYLIAYGRSEEEVKWHREHEATEADAGRAREALNWAQGLLDRDDADLNDYLHNLRVIVGAGSVEERGLGLACSILPVAERELGKVVEGRAAAAVSEYVGEVGKRNEFTLTVMYLNSYETQFGTKTICKFADGAGNRVTWFASGSPDLTVGETVRCKATPKRHEVYKGHKETNVQRLTVIERIAQAEAA